MSALFHVALGPSLHRHNCVCFSTRAPVLPRSMVPSFPLIHLRAPPSPSYSYPHLLRFNLTHHAQWSLSNAILATHTTIAPATISLTSQSKLSDVNHSVGQEVSPYSIPTQLASPPYPPSSTAPPVYYTAETDPRLGRHFHNQSSNYPIFGSSLGSPFRRI